MKPYKALELPTPADFSQLFLDEALNLLRDEMTNKQLSWKDAYSTLYVSIEYDDLVRAIDLARSHGLHLGLKPKFEQDEWAIEVLVVGEKSDRISFWCPGA